MRGYVLALAVWASGAAFSGGQGGHEPPGPAPAVQGYAIVVAQETLGDAGWRGVVDALQKKHSATVFQPEAGGLAGLRGKLADFRPRYVCFVMRPEELAREGRARVQTRDGRSFELPLCGVAYRDMAALMASLDDGPYDDALWAVLTGATPQDALRVVSAGPLTVRRGLSHVGSGWLEWLESGISFSECKKAQMWGKQPGKPSEERVGPDDTTKAFVEELNTGRVDMVSTSGHATEHDWQLGFSYRNGQLATPLRVARLPLTARTNYQELLNAKVARGEQAVAHLLGVDTSSQVLEVLADNPKVYFSPGNCRIARVDGKDCMALAWVHNGALQFFGHVGLQTRSCYAWGVAEYFLALQGRFTFAEAVWLNQQALRWELSQMSDQERIQNYTCCRNDTPMPAEGKFFWETTVLYGDPAWEARVKVSTEPLYEQALQSRRLAGGDTELTLTVTMRRASLPSRPAAFVPAQLSGSFALATPPFQVEVKEGPRNLLVTGRFALVPFWKASDQAPEKGKEYRAVVVVRRAPLVK